MNELEENDDSLDYIEDVKTNIEELHRKYDAIIDKDVDELSSISKELQENLDYVISRYNETKNEELKEFFDLESEFKYKVKSDYTFHKKINKSKNAFKIINEYLNDNKKVNIALMYEQLKKINDFVDDIWIKNHQSEIIINADQIFRENLKGKLENVKELYDEAISVEYN